MLGNLDPCLLGGSGVISRETIVITLFILLTTVLITSKEPPYDNVGNLFPVGSFIYIYIYKGTF